MLGITDLPTYLVGLILIILLPGPNSLYVLSVAARRGVRSGYAGASYLLWLAIGMIRAAWGMWRSRRTVAEQLADASAEAGLVETTGRERPYRRALVISLLNPKAILFFVAFFVQFVDPAYAHPAVSFLALGTLATLASAAYLSILIFAGTRLADAFRRRKGLSATATSAVGAVFVGFAVKLALASA